MSQEFASPSASRPAPIHINRISFADVTGSLRAGVADFAAAPLFGVFFGGLYAVGGIIIFYVLRYHQMPWLIIPLAVGFPLIGPFIAVGLYEVSRRLIGGRPLVWRDILLVVFAQRHRQVGWMAFVVLFIFWMWMYQVRLLLAVFLGFKSFSSIDSFIGVITTTSAGLGFLAVGTLIGAALSFVLFSATVVAIPLLLEREADMVTAMIASFRSVMQNLLPMVGFGIVVAVLTFFALLPLFLGLVVVIPVLGHATWHLYKKIVAPAA